MLVNSNRLLVEIPREFQPLNWISNTLKEIKPSNVLIISDYQKVKNVFKDFHNYTFYTFNNFSYFDSCIYI